VTVDLQTPRPATAARLDDGALDTLFRHPRTARGWADAPVDDDVLARVYDLVRWSPTATNASPLRLLAVRSPEARARLVTHMDEGNRERVRTAPLTLVVAADTDFHETLPRTFPHFPGAKDVFADETGREAAARFNATLQIGYFLLGVRAAGLAAGPMTGFDAAALDADLLAGTSLKSLVVVNIGKPGENAWFDRLPRLDVDEAVRTL